MNTTVSAPAPASASVPAVSASLSWHDSTRLLGVQVHAYFFDPAEVNARACFVERNLPVFARARPQRDGHTTGGTTVDTTGDTTGDDRLRPSFVAGDLSAQPDAVLVHGNALLCLTYRYTEHLLVDRALWPSQLRVDAMLQSIAGAMAVAGARQQPAAALLRIGNALLLFSPGPPVLECLASSVGAARRYWNAPQAITASQLAGFCEPRLRAMPGIGATPAATPPSRVAGV